MKNKFNNKTYLDRNRVIFLIMVFFIFLELNSALINANLTISYPTNNIVSLNQFVNSYNVEFENKNLSESPTATLSLSSSINGKVYLSSTSLTNIASRKSVTVSLIPGIPAGLYEGTLIWSDNGHPSTNGEVQISAVAPNITNSTPANYDIIVFPTSKVVTVQQGSEKTQNLMITVPSNYPRPIIIQSVDFNPGTETISFGDLNLGTVTPGTSIQIPIVFSGKEAQAGTYMTNLNIFATDSLGRVNLPSVSLTLQVTIGVVTPTGDTFSTPPTCSLSATTLNLNNTFSFTCSGITANLQVEPQYSEYLQGKKVEVSSGLYRYDFTPLKYGETDFVAVFRYNGAPIFQTFKQAVKITSSGSLVPGTTLKFIFTPNLDNIVDDTPILIQLVDNKTGSLVTNPKIWVNAILINSSSDTFEYKFDTGKNYDLRGKADGYEDITQSVNVTPKIINININPSTGDTSTYFNITTSVDNATIVLGGTKYYGNYYGLLSSGLNIIQASKDGYNTQTINFTVTGNVRIIAISGEFKKNIQQNFSLSNNCSWRVDYKSSLSSLDTKILYQGVSDSIKFTPDKKGVYMFYADNYNIGTYEINGFSFSKKFWFMPIWGWIILLIALVIAGYLYFKNKSDDIPNDGGMSFNVGE